MCISDVPSAPVDFSSLLVLGREDRGIPFVAEKQSGRGTCPGGPGARTRVSATCLAGGGSLRRASSRGGLSRGGRRRWLRLTAGQHPDQRRNDRPNDHHPDLITSGVRGRLIESDSDACEHPTYERRENGTDNGAQQDKQPSTQIYPFPAPRTATSYNHSTTSGLLTVNDAVGRSHHTLSIAKPRSTDG